MRRLGLLLALTACAPGTGESSTEVDLGTSTTDDGTTMQGVQTVTSETMDPDTGSTAPSSTGGATEPTTEPVSGSSSGSDSGDTGTTGMTEAVCGDGKVEGDEACDDGNSVNNDGCTNECDIPGCGDGVLQPGETCDDGNRADDDACTNGCKVAICGDGKVQTDVEECDDANTDQNDDCLGNCKQARCGDGILWAGKEVCDDGFNDGEYNGCATDCKSKADEYCGDGVVQDAYEHCDGATGLMGVDCTECLFDFSSVSQMSCAKTCSWAGASGCGKEDADVFCKLRTGNPGAKAADFKLVAPTDKGGFPCSDPKVFFDPDLRKPLGLLTEFGVNKPVYYQESQIAFTHGTAQVIQGSTLVCTNN
jgi:cysteine-rich repeat protein